MRINHPKEAEYTAFSQPSAIAQWIAGTTPLKPNIANTPVNEKKNQHETDTNNLRCIHSYYSESWTRGEEFEQKKGREAGTKRHSEVRVCTLYH